MKFLFLLTLVFSQLASAENIKPQYIDFGSNHGIIPSVKNEELTICLTGTSPDNEMQWMEWTLISMLRWLEPLREVSRDGLTENIVFGDTNCDVRFRVVSGAWGMTSNIGTHPVVTVGPNVPFGVVVHEFGHVFGLSDTYQNGTSGNCRPGQPQALMCNISFSEPQPDDIAGIRAVFKREFGDD